MSTLAEAYDHQGVAVHHGRARVNGIRLHYITAGHGPPLLLLHGTPKNSFYWYRLFPLLTPSFTLIAPDLRGFGYSDKPPATEGYDSQTNATDLGELMTQLGHSNFHVHGEDRGAEYAYAVAATFRDRVLSLSFAEMVLTGFGLEETSYWTQENISAQYDKKGIWCWHLPFFWLPHVPEMLIQGHEGEFWEMFINQECFNPAAIEPKALDHRVECVKQPGGLRGVLETYRSAWVNREVNLRHLREGGKLTCPVMTTGVTEFFGASVKECMEKVVERVSRDWVVDDCGHSIALEKPVELAHALESFMLGDS